MGFPTRKPHYCPFCKYKCFRKSGIEIHIRHHTQEKPFFCDKCKREFSNENSLKAHFQNVHLSPNQKYEKKNKCSFCTYSAHKKYLLDDHIIRIHTGERSFPCQYPNCEYAAKSVQALKKHNIRRHTTERNFLCRFPNCGYRGGKTKYDMSQHLKTHSENRPFSCDFPGCNYRAKNKGTLTSHKTVNHYKGSRPRPFTCSMCSHSTTTKTLLRSHELTHSEEKPIKCDRSGCAYSFKTKSCLNQHVVLHHTEKTFECDFEDCSATAASRSMLEKHKKNVHSEEVYKFPSCNFQTKYKLPFENHLQRHNNARQRTPCPHKGCTFRSMHQDSFKRHLASHKANLGCPEEGCSYAGRSSSSLKRHMEIHDPTGRPFPCPLCPKKFSKKAYRSQHLKTHTEEKPVKCPACPYASKIKHNMMRHVRRCHTDAFPDFGLDRKSTCDHCHVNFACAIGLAMHKLQFKTPVVVLTRLKLKLDTSLDNCKLVFDSLSSVPSVLSYEHKSFLSPAK